SLIWRPMLSALGSIGVNWGQKHKKTGCAPCGFSVDKIGIRGGQVGQESHLRPAVVEHSARCPDSSKNVQPLCSQFCCQRDLHTSAGKRWLEVRNALFHLVTSKRPDILISTECHFGEHE